MLASTQILLVGFDTQLLRTRALILERDGFKVDQVDSLRELFHCLSSMHYALVVLCHSLAAVEQSVAISLVAAFVPEVKLLVLEKQLPASLESPFAYVLNTTAGPEAFRCAVHALVSPTATLTRLEERKAGMAQLEGTVKWFNNAKGYGFLGRGDGGADVFIHYSSIQSEGYKSLNEGDPVTFDVVQGEKGPQADQVRLRTNNT